MKWRRSLTNKPLPLKQRTSSVDARRDYNAETWWSVLGLLKVREFVISVDHFSIWRRHLAWAMENGKNLRDHMTQRYASSMVFMSLLLSTELNVLFNSSHITTNMRSALQNEEIWQIEFWIGITIILSAVLTVLSLISTYTAWGMVSSVHENNAHCIFRSSLGQYVAELPGRLVVYSIYSFLLWIMMFFFVLLPVGFWSIALAIGSFLLFLHTICVFSAFGRIIMHSGCMGHQRVFEQSYERNLLPHSLHAHLLAKSRANLSKNTSILRQYRMNSRPIDHFYSEEELSEYLATPVHDNESIHNNSSHHDAAARPSYSSYNDGGGSEPSSFYDSNYDYSPDAASRRRTDSTVRFADEVDMVTSSPPKNIARRPNRNETEADTPVSQLSTPSSSRESGTPDSSKSGASSAAPTSPKTLQQQQEQADALRSSRPGVVKRDRSNTAASDNDFEALLESRRASPKTINKKPAPLPPAHSNNNNPPPTRPMPPRTESDSAMNAPTNNARDWLQTRTPTRDKRASTGSLPPFNNAPGLSVLENAAKLQRQWQNSYSDRRSNSGLSSSPPPPPEPLQQLWVSSSPTLGSRKDFPHRDSFGSLPTSSRNPSPVPFGPPQSGMSQSSSADALSSVSRRSVGAESALSKEEEEAYLEDYGSFEELPDVEAGTDPPPWETAHRQSAPGRITEAASLLAHDGFVEYGTQSYMGVDESTPKQKNTHPWKKSNNGS